MTIPTSLYALAFMGTFLAIFTIGLSLFTIHLKRWAVKRDEFHAKQMQDLKKDLETQILGTIRDLVRDNRNLINKIANQKTA